MLFLVFELGEDRYAIETSAIVHVVPFVDVKGLAQATPGVAGVLDYGGTPVPVIDLCLLGLGRPATRRLSTRIVLANYIDEQSGAHLLGLIVERATQTLRREAHEFAPIGMANAVTPYLGPVTRDERGLVQRIDVNRLLSDPIRALLCDAKRAG